MLSVKLRRRLKTTYKNSTFFDFLFPISFLGQKSLVCFTDI